MDIQFLINFLFNRLSEPIIVLNADLNIEFINKAYIEIFQISENDIVNHHIDEFSDIHKINLYKLFSYNSVESGIYEFETVTIYIDSKPLLINWNILKFSNELINKYLLIGSFVNDSCKHKDDIKIYLETIVQNVPHTIFWKDKNLIYLGCNKAFADFVGLENPEEIIGKNDYDLPAGKEQSDSFREDDKEVINNKISKLNIEEALTLPNGETADILTSKIPLLDNNSEVVGVLGIFTDITELKKTKEMQIAEAIAKAKAEEEKQKAIMVLTGSIVHDLRTPILTVRLVGSNIDTKISDLINGYMKACEAGIIENKFRKIQLDALSNAGKKLDNIATEMNEFINVTLKTLSKTLVNELTQEDLLPCSMMHCVRQTIRHYPFESQERNLIELIETVDFNFLGNEVLMIRILTNLIKNAMYQIHKNKTGKISIWAEDIGAMNCLYVRDTAGGAPPEVIQHLFDGYKTTKVGGTGVGLAFCQKTMQEFGGEIQCRSEYGDYIEFLLFFPKVNK